MIMSSWRACSFCLFYSVGPWYMYISTNLPFCQLIFFVSPTRKIYNSIHVKESIVLIKCCSHRSLLIMSTDCMVLFWEASSGMVHQIWYIKNYNKTWLLVFSLQKYIRKKNNLGVMKLDQSTNFLPHSKHDTWPQNIFNYQSKQKYF